MLTSVWEVIVLWTNTENWFEKQEQLENKEEEEVKKSQCSTVKMSAFDTFVFSL